MACLDTSVLIDLMRPRSAHGRRAARLVAELHSLEEPLCTTRLNVAELYVGVMRSTDPPREEHRVREVLSDLRILEFDDRAARLFGAITGAIMAAGRPAGDMDVLIAATALAHGETIATRNARHFEGLPGLTIVTY